MTTQIKGNATSTFGGAITANNVGAGNVLQVVQGTYSTYSSTTNTSYTDTGLTATITPTSSSSKILVLVHLQDVGKEGGNGRGAFNLVRGATQISYLGSVVGYTASTSANYIGNVSTAYLDSPATTSATTYKVQWKLIGSATVYLCNDSTVSTITLVEVAG